MHRTVAALWADKAGGRAVDEMLVAAFASVAAVSVATAAGISPEEVLHAVVDALLSVFGPTGSG